MKVVFIGAVEFSLCMLRTLLFIDVEIVGVVTSKDQRINADHADLLPECKKHNLSVLVTDDVNSSQTLDWVRQRSPDVVFCFGWSRLIKRELLQLPRLGIVGYHPASLPKNRGRHPLIWALVLGLKETASTFFFMNEGADSGDILSQVTVKISNSDDAQELYSKVIRAAEGQLDILVPQLIHNTFRAIPQDESNANYWRKRGDADGRIDWRMSSHSIHNLVRGLSKPYVGAHFIYEEQSYKVWKAEKINDTGNENIEPGKVMKTSEDNLVVKCGEGCIKLLDIEPMMEFKEGMYL